MDQGPSRRDTLEKRKKSLICRQGSVDDDENVAEVAGSYDLGMQQQWEHKNRNNSQTPETPFPGTALDPLVGSNQMRKLSLAHSDKKLLRLENAPLDLFEDA
jgi:hypothetical protein